MTASPIEDRMRLALLHQHSKYILVDGTGHQSTRRAHGTIWPDIWLDEDHERAIYIYRSVAVLTYRVDFMLEFGARRLAIECDGHEFHDRTKQQAAYDRSRDRELLILGIPVIRFTGSEIVHSPERCASEAYRCLLALPDERKANRYGWNDAIYFTESMPGIDEHW